MPGARLALSPTEKDGRRRQAADQRGPAAGSWLTLPARYGHLHRLLVRDGRAAAPRALQELREQPQRPGLHLHLEPQPASPDAAGNRCWRPDQRQEAPRGSAGGYGVALQPPVQFHRVGFVEEVLPRRLRPGDGRAHLQR